MAPISETSCYATLLMNDEYLPGAMVMGWSLRNNGAVNKKIVALVTIDNVSASTITELKTVYDEVLSVNRITNQTPANLYLMNRPDLISTFTKVELWRQTQYKRIVYIDADAVCLRAPNELLSLDTDFAAVPDIGWPDCFNSGVMVLNPDMGDYYSLLALAQRGISFDGADQGLLNMHFREWERLSFTYNCTPSGNYQYLPAYRHFQSSINIIHYIGKDKPWTLGRENKMSTGVYGELLGRWWAVYDKHYRLPKTAYYSGRYQERSKTVQDYVKGEETLYLPGYSQGQPQEPPTIAIKEPQEAPPVATEQPIHDQPDTAKQLYEEAVKSLPTVDRKKFSAPQVNWDPARAPPPAKSGPEAANFPNQQYDFSKESTLFTPPSRYPEAPRDMYYQVPPERTGLSPPPKPIFPWEAHAPKATRVFPTYKAPSPPPIMETEPPAVVAASEAPQQSSYTQTQTEDAPWNSFTRGNAWDEVPEIERYVQAVNQARKGKIQVLHHTPSEQTTSEPLMSPPIPEDGRRPSMKLTDFPTEIERPSLPVTPAPIRRPSFWGEERDELGELPAAEGVPKQSDWNPAAKLEELQRRQSEVLESGPPILEAKDLPKREMPESESAEAVAEKAISPTKAPKMPKPILREPHFEIPTKAQDDSELSPSSSGPTPAFNPITLVGEAASVTKSVAAV